MSLDVEGGNESLHGGNEEIKQKRWLQNNLQRTSTYVSHGVYLIPENVDMFGVQLMRKNEYRKGKTQLEIG